MDLDRELSGLSNDEAETALQALVKNWTIHEPEYAALVTSESTMQALLKDAGEQVGLAAAPLPEPSPEHRDEVVRTALRMAAADPKLRPSLENYLKYRRPQLFEPVTTAITLAGIMLVLSTHVTFEAEGKGGKRTGWKVKIERKPSTEALLKKFFGILA